MWGTKVRVPGFWSVLWEKTNFWGSRDHVSGHCFEEFGRKNDYGPKSVLAVLRRIINQEFKEPISNIGKSCKVSDCTYLLQASPCLFICDCLGMQSRDKKRVSLDFQETVQF